MMNRELPIFKLLAVVFVVVLAIAYQRAKGERDAARVEVYNAKAALDTSRVILRDSTKTLTERLVFQQTQTITLSQDLDRYLRADGSRVQMLARLRLTLDSVQGAVTRGDVTGDSVIRYVSAYLDTLGFRVGINATVPPPPESATVHWDVAHEPESVIVALNRTQEGQLAVRAITGRNSTASIDSTVVRVESAARHNASLAAKGLLVIAGMVIAKLLF